MAYPRRVWGTLELTGAAEVRSALVITQARGVALDAAQAALSRVRVCPVLLSPVT